MKKKLAFIPLVLFAAVAYSAFSGDLSFKHGERSNKDIERDIQSKGPEIVSLAGIQKGMVVADILGGGGYYSEIISDKVGSSGKVLLHNNKAYMPYVEKELLARLADNRLPNVERYDRETSALQLGEDKIDAMFFILGYHDIYHTAEGWSIDSKSFLTQLSDAVKKGGKLIIVDHSAKEGTNTQDSQKLHRIDENYVIRELKSYGFKLVKSSEILANAEDSRKISPFNPEIRRKTDRFVLIFEKTS